MATPDIRVRSYNVGFGDCFLVSIPDGGETRHLLIDFGNAPGRAGSNKPFPDIAKDIKTETGGHLDVVVMTHEHLDHMEGFYSQKAIFNQMTVDQVWMSLPSHPDYYDDFPRAQPQKKLRALAGDFAAQVKQRGLALAPAFKTLMLNNLSNVDRIDYVRKMAGDPAKVKYLRRGSRVTGKPASRNIKFRVLAPEKDVSVYYKSRGGGDHDLTGRRFQMTLGSFSAADGMLVGDDVDLDPWEFPEAERIAGEVPPNLSESDWSRLRESIQGGAVDAIRSIDKAANNTSLAFLIEAHGKRLFFPGDAELESWEMMKKEAKNHLGAVDFFKVSHHGSHNGTDLELLDQLLPVSRKSKAAVMISTRSKVYGTKHPVPDKSLLKELKKRCKELVSTDDLPASKRWVDVKI